MERGQGLVGDGSTPQYSTGQAGGESSPHRVPLGNQEVKGADYSVEPITLWSIAKGAPVTVSAQAIWGQACRQRTLFRT